MKISQKKRSELYKAIADPIMDLRLKNQHGSANDRRKMDDHLFNLEREIYDKIKNVLNLSR